ncbi:MAG: enoyl-CoA hydratase-related protein [Bacteroidota bacterium]
MKQYDNITLNIKKDLATLQLNRPEKRNAINGQTMDELIDAMQQIQSFNGISMIHLTSTGKDFSAGADLQWMRDTQQMNVDQIQQQNQKLQKIFGLWFDMPFFTFATIRGNVVGGALGLVAASDFVVAHPETKFRFSEVSLGLLPATIAPFVLQRTQSRFIRNAMLTAAPFHAYEALNAFLVDVVADDMLAEKILHEYQDNLRKNEPNALTKCKLLINDLMMDRIEQPIAEYTTRLLAEVRKSDAAAKRIEKFFQK